MPLSDKKAQSERLWNFLLYSSKQHILRDQYNQELNQIEKLSPEQKKIVLDQNLKQRIKDGLPRKIEISPEVDRMEEYLRDDIEKMLFGVLSDDSIRDGFELLGEMIAKVYVEYGKEAERVKSRFVNVKNRDEKAILVTAKCQNLASTLDEQVNTIKTGMLSYLALYLDDEEKIASYMASIENATNAAREKMSDEDKKLFDIGSKVKNGFELSDDLKKYNEVNGPADKLAKAYEHDNIVRAYGELRDAMTPKVVANVTKFDTKRVDTTLLRGIVADLESTGTGEKDKSWYEKLWHGGNTDKYSDMLKNIKLYINTVEANENGKKLFYAQNKMIESVKAYLSGKETMRKHAFGQKRVDDALLLLAEVMPEQEFQRTITDPINEKRMKAGEEEHVINVNSFYRDRRNPSPNNEHGRMRRLGLEGMDEIQRKTNEFSTTIPEKYKVHRMDELIDNVFGPNPVENEMVLDMFRKDGTQYFKQFQPIKDKFTAIGRFTYEDKLSDKDFAALGYLATKGPVGFFMTKPGDKYNVKKYTPLFEKGRQDAADAMRQYEAGNKEPLAKLLADGIKKLTNGYQNMVGLSKSLIPNREMLARAQSIMSRDPELMRLAFDKEVGGLTKEDMENARGVARGAEVVARAKMAKEKIYSHQNGSKPLSDSEYLKYLVDVETYTLMDYNMITRHGDPDLGKGNKAFKQNYLQNTYHINLGKALESDEGMRELRQNIKQLAIKNKMINYSTNDSRKHKTDVDAFDASLSVLRQKMPKLQTEVKKVERKTTKNAEAGRKK